MTAINAYLLFDGNCREAMEFYNECLGGELTIHTFEGAPDSDKMTEEAKKGVMHANIVKGPLALMASDNGGMGPALIAGNTVSLSLNCESDEEIEACFNKLSAGGKVTLPLGDQFWGAKFGMLTDKFGFHWMLNYHKMPKQ